MSASNSTQTESRSFLSEAFRLFASDRRAVERLSPDHLEVVAAASAMACGKGSPFDDDELLRVLRAAVQDRSTVEQLRGKLSAILNRDAAQQPLSLEGGGRAPLQANA
ncbi:MAG: hypothetical protein WDN10_00070 [bacterium]